MIPSTRGMIVAALAGLALAACAGCGRPRASIQYVTEGGGRDVAYDFATFQLARERKVQIILFCRTAAPIGEADPDFEYVFFELPEAEHYGWLREDRVPAYRWVREGGKNQVWLGTAGQVGTSLGDSKQHLHFNFRVTMEPVGDTLGGAYVFSGKFKVLEDIVRTQGLINRYGAWLGSLVNPVPPPPPDAKAKPAAAP